ncbi:MAG: hypothetical protein ACRES6_05520 [Steroidobacteraceae bacterium]
MPRTTSALRWGGIVPAVCLMGACGYFGGSGPASSAHSLPKAQAAQPLDPTARALAGMVEAVGSSGAQPPVELKFSIRDRPQIGQDDEVDYALVPEVTGIDTLRLGFLSDDGGLQVVGQGPALAAIKPVPGVPIFGSVTIRPLKTGLFTLIATVGVGSASQSMVWPFRIPVIAADGPAQTAANQP